MLIITNLTYTSCQSNLTGDNIVLAPERLSDETRFNRNQEPTNLRHSTFISTDCFYSNGLHKEKDKSDTDQEMP